MRRLVLTLMAMGLAVGVALAEETAAEREARQVRQDLVSTAVSLRQLLRAPDLRADEAAGLRGALSALVQLQDMAFGPKPMAPEAVTGLRSGVEAARASGLAWRRRMLLNRGGLRAACSYADLVRQPQYKANLHCHTWHSDGSQVCDVTAAWYREHGYQVLAMTDHDAYGDQDGGVCSARLQNDKAVHDWDGDGVLHETVERRSGVETYVRDYSRPAPPWVPRSWQLEQPGEFVVLNGLEASFGHPHINVVGCPAGDIPDPREGYAFMDWGRSTGGVAFQNHPSGWNGRPASLHAHPDLSRLDGLEVMNGFLARDNRNGKNADGAPGFAEPLWNGCLDAGLRLWGFANDDSHTVDPTHFAGAGSAWNMIWSRALARPEVTAALRAGAFYATCGIVVDRVEITPEALRVHSPNATHAQVIGDGGQVLAASAGGEIRYTLTGSERWLRVVLWNDTMCYPVPEPQYVQKAWLQPIMLQRLLAPAEALAATPGSEAAR